MEANILFVLPISSYSKYNRILCLFIFQFLWFIFNFKELPEDWDIKNVYLHSIFHLGFFFSDSNLLSGCGEFGENVFHRFGKISRLSKHTKGCI